MNEDDAQLNVQLTVDDADTSNTHTFSDNGPIAGLCLTAMAQSSSRRATPLTKISMQVIRSLSRSITVTDSSGDSASESFDIVVTGVNDAPVATYTTANAINEDGAPPLTDTPPRLMLTLTMS